MIDAKEFFQKDGIAPSRYQKVLDATFGEEWYEWSGETLGRTISEHFKSEVNEFVFAKIRALQLIRVSNKCYTDFLVFEKVVFAFNDLPVDWETIQAPDPEHMAYAVSCIKEIYPECEFGMEVSGFVASICTGDGFVVLPPPLQFAQDALDRANRGTIAAEAKEMVASQIKDMKKTGQLEGDSLLAHAVNKYLAVMAFVDKKRGLANG